MIYNNKKNPHSFWTMGAQLYNCAVHFVNNIKWLHFMSYWHTCGYFYHNMSTTTTTEKKNDLVPRLLAIILSWRAIREAVQVFTGIDLFSTIGLNIPRYQVKFMWRKGRDKKRWMSFGKARQHNFNINLFFCIVTGEHHTHIDCSKTDHSLGLSTNKLKLSSSVAVASWQAAGFHPARLHPASSRFSSGQDCI